MAFKPNDCGRLNLKELLDYKENSGLTNRQYQILKRKFYDSDEPNRQMICTELNISTVTYNNDLRKALKIINAYKINK